MKGTCQPREQDEHGPNSANKKAPNSKGMMTEVHWGNLVFPWRKRGWLGVTSRLVDLYKKNKGTLSFLELLKMTFPTEPVTENLPRNSLLTV